ncbi:MAG TPA: TIGR02147 family protein [bacterium]|nr:TIGR02147 family protein [bacterium]HQG14066.1 TIGR02147 family protein [bacterium]HQH80066.1 TIGR02147 family protein [bacterium]
MADIFTYMDYRNYLKDVFEELKRERSSFSHRQFASAAGFRSSNFVLLVMQGKRNLSSEATIKISKALKLKKKESEFFENLVRFNQAKTDDERNFYYGRILENREYLLSRPLEKGQYEYYSNWYVPVIREMLLMSDFQEDPAWIADHVDPRITESEAKAALDLLVGLGLVIRDESGRLKQSSPHLFSGDDVASLAIANFQREMINIAARSIDSHRMMEREIGSLTFAVSKKKLDAAKKMIREFRSKMAGFLAESDGADAVYQFNFQLFNVSKENKGGASA